MQIKAVWAVVGMEVVWPPFFVPKVAKMWSGVTAGVTKWGYISGKVGLHIRGFRG